VLFNQYPESLSHGPVISLIGCHSSSSFSSTSTPLSKEPHERESKMTFYLRLPFACCFELFGCLELFPNSHLSILREWYIALESATAHMDKSPSGLSPSSSLIVFFELFLRLLASDKKDQPPHLIRLENLLI
jgi:hypothetical protein